LIKTQIERAQKLHIHFYACSTTLSRPQIEMLELLTKNSSRWEELDVILTEEIVPILATLRDRLPSLERLWIQWEGQESQDSVEFIDCFHTAPSLVEVGISNQFRHVPTLLIHACQLTRYYLDAPWEVHEGLLQLASNLVEAHI
jgi:hypothetical protein